jgi:hypothetical protein
MRRSTLTPDDPNLLIDRASRSARSAAGGAVADWTRALALDPERAEALVLPRRGLAPPGPRRARRRDIERALALEPDNAEALLERGTCASSSATTEGARMDWERARGARAEQRDGGPRASRTWRSAKPAPCGADPPHPAAALARSWRVRDPGHHGRRLALLLLAPVLVALAPALGGCAERPHVVVEQPRPRAAKPRRQAHVPILRPVRDHVSDSIPDAFPALGPPVLEEAVFAGHRENRILRARLQTTTPAQPPAPEPPMPADLGSGRLAANGQGGGD